MSSFIVNYEKPQLRIAEVKQGKIFDLDVEHLLGDLGSIFFGKVSNVLSGMDAAFVDIGQRKNGLLHFRDVHWSSLNTKKERESAHSLYVGQPLLVQVARPGIGEKGPKLTTRISVPGRLVVLVFPSDTVGVSRKIESDSERNRLRNLSEKIRPLDCGIIVRTEAEGATYDDLSADLKNLTSQMEDLKLHAGSVNSPTCLHREIGILGKLVRDRLSPKTESVYIDDKDQFETCMVLAQFFVPSLSSKIKLYTDKKPIFEAFNLEKDINKTFNDVVSLPHGGSLIIQETEALVAIDVNTSRFIGKDRVEETILQTNLEAVEESALQIRLRDLAGVIAIDFIDMKRTKDRVQVLNALENALKQDRRKTHIVQLSPSGLVEITRSREGLSLQKSVSERCYFCRGSGRVKTPATMAVEIRRRMRSLANGNNHSIIVRTHPEVAAAILGPQCELLQDLQTETDGDFVIRVDENMHPESVHIEHTLPHIHDLNQNLVRVTISIHTPLYPKQSAEYAILEDYLVKLPTGFPIVESNNESRCREIVVLEVIEFGRWFATARIVRGINLETNTTN